MGNSASRRAKSFDADSERTSSPDQIARDGDHNFAKPTMFTDGSELWVYVKTKTTEKRQSSTVKKRWTFRASPVGVSLGKATGSTGTDANSSGMSFFRSMGSSHPQQLSDNYLAIPDESLMLNHVRLFLAPTGQVNQGSEATPQMSLALESKGRCYFLIGQGDLSFGAYPLEKESILKVGACSLQVVEAYGSAKLDPANCGYERQHPLPDGAYSDNACYICFEEGPGCRGVDDVLVPSPCTCSKPVHRSCLAQWISTKGSRVCSICKAKLPPKFTVDPPFLILQVVRHVRGLQWGGEREYILSFGNGDGKMPATKKAITLGSSPDCDLQLPDPSVSRVHARISFIAPSSTAKKGTPVGTATATIGAVNDQDGSRPATPGTPDTNSSTGLAAEAPPPAGHFEVEDLVSVSGSYLRVPPNRPFFLPLPGIEGGEPNADSGFPQGEAFYTFKIGRTVVEIRTRLRRAGASNGNILSRAAGLLTGGRIGVVPGEVLLTPPDTPGQGALAYEEIESGRRSRASSCGSYPSPAIHAHLQGSVAAVNRFSLSQLENDGMALPESSMPATPEAERVASISLPPSSTNALHRGILLQQTPPGTADTRNASSNTTDADASSPESQTTAETMGTASHLPSASDADKIASPISASTSPSATAPRSLPPRHCSGSSNVLPTGRTSPNHAEHRTQTMQRRIAFLHENNAIENALLRAAEEAEEAGVVFNPDKPLAVVSRRKGVRGSRGQSLVSGDFDINILGELNTITSHSEIEVATEDERLRAFSCDITSSMGTGASHSTLHSPSESHITMVSPKSQSLLGLAVVRAQTSDLK